jgi:molybdopterin molybdotransferase
VGDDPAHVLGAVRGADVDLVVTTGGASVGDYDPVKAALADHGVDFVSVAMQPGKPQGAGLVDGIPVVCLPGNPVAVAVCVELFVGAAVRAMLGVAEPEWRSAVAAASWKCPHGREQFMPVVIDDSGAVRPATSGGSGSHLAGRLATATALARVPADVTAVEPGDAVLVRRFTA